MLRNGPVLRLDRSLLIRRGGPAPSRTSPALAVVVTRLHYAQLNPLSVPFWSRQGYRPAWTTWQATPARPVR